jgi:hypothetical protein
MKKQTACQIPRAVNCLNLTEKKPVGTDAEAVLPVKMALLQRPSGATVTSPGCFMDACRVESP